MIKDYQRKKDYDWEDKVWKQHGHKGWDRENQMSPKEADKYATELWNKYKNKLCHNFYPRLVYCSQVKTKNVRGRGRPCMKSGFWYNGKEKYTKKGVQSFYKIMHLPEGSRTKIMIIHEISHALAPRTAHHNSEFVSIYVYLMAKELNFSLDYMVKTLNEDNIDFNFNFTKKLGRRMKAIQNDRLQTKSLALPITGRYLVLPSALKA